METKAVPARPWFVVAIVLAIGLAQGGPSQISIVRDRAVIATPSQAGFSTYLSKDGRTVMTGGMDGTIQFWKRDGSKTQFLDALRIEGFDNRPDGAGVAYSMSGDANTFAVSLWNGRVEVWQRSPLKRIYGAVPTTRPYGEIALHPTKPWLFIGAPSRPSTRIDLVTKTESTSQIQFPFEFLKGTLKAISLEGVTDLSTGKIVRRFKNKIDNQTPISISPDGQYAIVGGEDPTWQPPTEAATEAAYARRQTLRVWRLRDGKLLTTMPGFYTNSSPSDEIVWTGKNRIFAPALGYTRNVLTGRLIGRETEPDSDDFIHPANVVPLIETAKASGIQKQTVLNLPPSGPRILGFASDPNGSFLVWHEDPDFYHRKPRVAGTGQSYTLIGPDGRAKSAPVHQRIYGHLEFEASDPVVRQTFGSKGTAGTAIYSILSSVKAAKTKVVERTIIPNDGPPSRGRVTIPFSGNVQTGSPSGFEMNPMGSLQVAFGHNVVASVSMTQADRVTITSLASGKEMWSFSRPKTRIQPTSLAVSGQNVAFLTEDESDSVNRKNELHILRLSDGKEIVKLPCHDAYGMTFSPDGKRLALMGFTILGVVDLTEANSTLRRFNSPSNPVSGNLDDVNLGWSKDSRYLIASNSLRPIQIYDAFTRDLVATMRIFEDGTWLATRGDGAVDGSPSRLGMAYVWQNDGWVAASRQQPFMMSLLAR